MRDYLRAAKSSGWGILIYEFRSSLRRGASPISTFCNSPGSNRLQTPHLIGLARKRTAFGCLQFMELEADDKLRLNFLCSRTFIPESLFLPGILFDQSLIIRASPQGRKLRVSCYVRCGVTLLHGCFQLCYRF